MTNKERLSDAVVSFENNNMFVNDKHNEIEQVVAITENGYEKVYMARQ